LQREKNFEASLKIGVNRMNNGPLKSARFTDTRRGQENLTNTNGGDKDKDNKLGDTMTSNKTVDMKET